MTITVLALITAREGHEDSVYEVLKGFVAPTLEEKGCLEYVLHRSTDQKGLFMFYETWTSREDLERHLQSDHILKGREKTRDILSEPPSIRVFQKV
jgi:quinol monooxygenase YgiN